MPTPLRVNQEVWFYRIPAPEVPVPYRCETIFEDERLLVVDKPPFLATMPRGKHITQSATVQLRKLTGNGELSPAHRLDRLTSGVLVFTKTREVRGAYQQLFARREAEKTYEAIARYDPTNPMAQPGMVWRDPTVLPEAEEDFAVPMHLRAKMLRFTDPLSGVEREFRSLSIY